MREDAEDTPPRTTPKREGASRAWPTVAVVLVVLSLVLYLLGRFVHVPGLDDVFGVDTHDRSGPAVLKSVQDMHRYEGAAGNYQIVVDLEKDARLLPDSIRGTRTLFVASGSVAAYVDFGSIGQGSVTVDEKRTTATLRLPHARLAEPAVDPERSYTVSKQRGLIDRLGDLFSDNPADERAVHILAADRIGAAAKESDLTLRAEKNTTSMLQGLLRGLGFDHVTVTYGR